MTENDYNDETEMIFERGKLMVLVRFALTGALILIIVGGLLFIFADPPGSVRITSNVKGAVIILNSYPTEFTTDATLNDISPGEHLFSVEKPGYRIVGKFVRKLKMYPNGSDSLHFILEKIEETDGSNRN